MKQFFLILALFTALSFQAQVTIEANDLGVPGDTFRMSLADTLVDFHPLETGANQYWDYSEVSVKAQVIDTLVMLSEVPQAFQFMFFGKANYGMSSSFSLPGNLLDTLSMNIGFNFYNKSNKRLSRVGQGYLIQDAPIPVLYSSPDVIYNFPLTYGDKDTSESTFVLFVPGVGGVFTDQTRITHVDGYGTLITSLDTFDALRVRSELIRRDSIVYEGNSQVINSTIVEYKWLAKNAGVPLMWVNTQKLGPIELMTSVRFKDRYRSSGNPTLVSRLRSEESFKLYPSIVKAGRQLRYENPDNLQFENLSVFDMKGKRIPVKWSKNHKVVQIPADLGSGIYVLKATKSNRQFTARFVVSR